MIQISEHTYKYNCHTLVHLLILRLTRQKSSRSEFVMVSVCLMTCLAKTMAGMNEISAFPKGIKSDPILYFDVVSEILFPQMKLRKW